MKKRLIIGILLCVGMGMSFAASPAIKFSDAQLYQAYLKKDMRVWNSYLHATRFEVLTNAEKMRYVNYEYGYVATAIDDKLDDAEQHLKNFEEHVNALENILPKATVLTYRSSIAAYKAMLNKWTFASNGLKSVQLVAQAFEVDSTNPMTLSLKGNVDFYSPKAFGGNKQRALKYFLQAEQLFVARGDTLNNWNLTATRLCLIQCYQKTHQLDKAIALAEKMLQKDPNFVFLRDELYPELMKANKMK